MKLSELAIPKGVERYPPKKKEPTEFERKRAACQTYDELVQLGYDEGMAHPEGWADHVWATRHHR